MIKFKLLLVVFHFAIITHNAYAQSDKTLDIKRASRSVEETVNGRVVNEEKELKQNEKSSIGLKAQKAKVNENERGLKAASINNQMQQELIKVDSKNIETTEEKVIERKKTSSSSLSIPYKTDDATKQLPKK